MEQAIKDRLDNVFGLYEKHGNENYGENVTQLEHMVQCGHLALEQDWDDEVVLAAFFHDIGHLCAPEGHEYMGEFGAQQHDLIGAAYLIEKGFSEKVAELTKGHVLAKRYLTHKYPDYYEKLSNASRQTLEYQGGKMTESEAVAFEADPLFELHIKMREWDDEGKRTDLNLTDTSPFYEIAARHLQSRSSDQHANA